ncbi:MAG TPA: hypothetical protein VFD36_09960, partial [Kofleriaceae bacterium]|nr:hypothetical protein [Kofleriaceae bacterium]
MKLDQVAHLALERDVAGDQLEQDAAERVDVAAVIDLGRRAASAVSAPATTNAIAAAMIGARLRRGHLLLVRAGSSSGGIVAAIISY